jgi:hypothetical protein
MRGEIAAGNVSCGMGAGVPSIEVTANAAELKNASRMFRPNAVSKSRTGISNFPFGSGYVVTAHPPAVSAPLRTLARVAGFELGGYAVAVAPVGDSALLDDRSEGLGGRRSLGRAFNSRRSSAFMPVHDVPLAGFTASFARVRLTKSLSRPFGSRRRYMPGHFPSGKISGGKLLFFGVAGP